MSILNRIQAWFSRNSNGAADRYFADLANWQHVSSSNVDSISYFIDLTKGVGKTGTLGVRFHTSRTEYRYRDVPLSVFTAFLAASSKGKFVHTALKGKYKFDPPRSY